MEYDLLLPSCGLNHLWQLGAIRALHDLGLDSDIQRVYGSSGGAWSAIFLGSGIEAVIDYLDRAPSFYESWQRQNKFRYIHRMTKALRDESESMLKRYGFFEGFNPPFECYFKLVQLYPEVGAKFVDVRSREPRDVHRLAVASSTIPFVTGVLARVDKSVYIDGGFSPGFDLKDCSDRKISLDPQGSLRVRGAFHVSPSKTLPSGLRLGIPITYPRERIQALIDDGYQSVMSKKYELLSYLQHN